MKRVISNSKKRNSLSTARSIVQKAVKRERLSAEQVRMSFDEARNGGK